MAPLLRVSRTIDSISGFCGLIATWLVLVVCLVSAGNAISRHFFNASSNVWIELQWYMLAGMVLLGAPQVLLMNAHVRVDLLYSSIPERARLWIDMAGASLFLLPACLMLVYFTWPYFVDSWRIHESSSNAGGLLRWPVKLLLPLGFALMSLQGISEIIKAAAALAENRAVQHRYETPLQ